MEDFPQRVRKIDIRGAETPIQLDIFEIDVAMEGLEGSRLYSAYHSTTKAAMRTKHHNKTILVTIKSFLLLQVSDVQEQGWLHGQP